MSKLFQSPMRLTAVVIGVVLTWQAVAVATPSPQRDAPEAPQTAAPTPPSIVDEVPPTMAPPVPPRIEDSDARKALEGLPADHPLRTGASPAGRAPFQIATDPPYSLRDCKPGTTCTVVAPPGHADPDGYDVTKPRRN